jgi:hypothetical protein
MICIRRDLIDVEPSNGDIYKMFLGSLIPKWDEKRNRANSWMLRHIAETDNSLPQVTSDGQEEGNRQLPKLGTSPISRMSVLTSWPSTPAVMSPSDSLPASSSPVGGRPFRPSTDISPTRAAHHRENSGSRSHRNTLSTPRWSQSPFDHPLEETQAVLNEDHYDVSKANYNARRGTSPGAGSGGSSSRIEDMTAR